MWDSKIVRYPKKIGEKEDRFNDEGCQSIGYSWIIQ
jgi:hypothetical protein